MKRKLYQLVQSFVIAVMLVAATLLIWKISTMVLPIIGVSGAGVAFAVLVLTAVIFLVESY
jgi:hypothetical protein